MPGVSRFFHLFYPPKETRLVDLLLRLFSVLPG